VSDWCRNHFEITGKSPLLAQRGRACQVRYEREADFNGLNSYKFGLRIMLRGFLKNLAGLPAYTRFISAGFVTMLVGNS
jgi:hypothetical protein